MNKKKPFRFIPSAVSPFPIKYLFKSLLSHKGGLSTFERAVTAFIGVDYAYTFTSFMRAIYVILKSIAQIDHRRDVILPRFSCPTFAHAVMASGLKIRYCDINPATLSIDMKSLLSCDLRNVLALIVVNHFGLGNQMEKILNLCRREKINVIEDIGYSLGTEYKGKKMGSFGDFSVLNFKEGKGIPIGGGMVTTSNKDILSNFNTREQANGGRLRMIGYKILINPHVYYFFKKFSYLVRINYRKRLTSEDTYVNSESEYDYKFDGNDPLLAISDFQGMLGTYIMSSFEKDIEIRRKNSQILEEGLADLLGKGVTLIPREPGINKVHYIRYPILVKDKKRKIILDELLRQGIEARDIYSEIKPDPRIFPGAEKVSKEILTLPCHPNVKQRDLNLMLDILRRLS